MSSEPHDDRTPLSRMVHAVREQWTSQTLGLRLVGGYALLFVVSVCALAALSYGLLIYFLQQPDRDFIEGQTRTLSAVYTEGGTPALKRVLEGSPADERQQELIVRLADTQGRTLYLYNPDDWRPSEIEPLEREPAPAGQAWIPVGRAEDDDPLAALGVRLGPDRVLQVGMDADLRADVVRSMQNVFLAIVFPVLLLAVLGGTVLAYRALRPVRKLVQTFHAVIETGDVHVRAPTEDVQGEFAALVHLFNQMLDRIEQLVRGMHETLDDVAHDLRTPMTRLRGRAELALQRHDDPEALRDALADLIDASDLVLEMLNGMMDVAEARADALQLSIEPVPVSTLIDDVADAYALVADEKGVDLQVEVPDGLSVAADASRARQVVANLLDNAVKYTPTGGRVVVRARAEAQTDEVCIAVADDGIGISDEDLPRIWDRLYRGDRSRSERGLGLGLSLVQAIVEAHGGRVDVDSTPGEGSTFRIYLPAAQPNVSDVDVSASNLSKM